VRAALLLRLELDASYEEVAAELGVPSAEAARKALRRALDEVARQMEADAEGPH
jgi:DNA-directed RNA polymerase specialized sigma24 family protein